MATITEKAMRAAEQIAKSGAFRYDLVNNEAYREADLKMIANIIEVQFTGFVETLSACPTPERGLLPCPFCGGGAEVYPEESEAGYYVACFQPSWPVTECYAALGEEYDRDGMPEHRFRTKEEAIAAWNTRTTPPREYERGFKEGIEATAKAVEARLRSIRALTPQPGSQQEIQSQQIKVK